MTLINKNVGYEELWVKIQIHAQHHNYILHAHAVRQNMKKPFSSCQRYKEAFTYMHSYYT